MLETAPRHRFHFDIVQPPLNLLDANYKSFEKQVLPDLVSTGMGLGNEEYGKRSHSQEWGGICHRVSSRSLLEPSSGPESQIGRGAADGAYELFKTTSILDSTAQHPEWLGRESSRTQRLAGD